MVADGDALSYDKPLYGCSACNASKGKQLVPNPLTALGCADVRVNDDGTIESHTCKNGILVAAAIAEGKGISHAMRA